MLQKLLPEWKLPEPAEKDPTAEGRKRLQLEPWSATPDVEKQPEQPQGKGKPPGPADKGKGKTANWFFLIVKFNRQRFEFKIWNNTCNFAIFVSISGKEDKKEAKASKGDKSQGGHGRRLRQARRVAIFASYYDATRRQPLQVTSLADCANKSEQLRQRGFSYLYSHPVQLTKFRAWKLIRPKVKRPLPRSEAPDASACGEVGDAVGGVTEEKPI
uniref:40S ribosomal protein S6 n=1 Tax=Macrostomum lignano TaxID=282301 RepID=A0A1I8IVJ2_9PLAT